MSRNSAITTTAATMRDGIPLGVDNPQRMNSEIPSQAADHVLGIADKDGIYQDDKGLAGILETNSRPELFGACGSVIVHLLGKAKNGKRNELIELLTNAIDSNARYDKTRKAVAKQQAVVFDAESTEELDQLAKLIAAKRKLIEKAQAAA